MKALIIYSSKTGNTKKVAYGIYEKISFLFTLLFKLFLFSCIVFYIHDISIYKCSPYHIISKAKL